MRPLKIQKLPGKDNNISAKRVRENDIRVIRLIEKTWRNLRDSGAGKDVLTHLETLRNLAASELGLPLEVSARAFLSRLNAGGDDGGGE